MHGITHKNGKTVIKRSFKKEVNMAAVFVIFEV